MFSAQYPLTLAPFLALEVSIVIASHVETGLTLVLNVSVNEDGGGTETFYRTLKSAGQCGASRTNLASAIDNFNAWVENIREDERKKKERAAKKIAKKQLQDTFGTHPVVVTEQDRKDITEGLRQLGEEFAKKPR